VPQPITTLPLLDWVAAHTTDSRLADTIIIAHTHLLPNNLPFFRHLAYLVGPSKIFVLEKPYSTVKSVFNDLIKSGLEVFPVGMEAGRSFEFATQKSLEVLWRRVLEEQKKNGFKKILIVDDGGDVWLSLPWQNLEGVSVVGVEQTQRGITRIQNSSVRVPPIVSVASSGIKKIVEAGFIGESVIKKMDQLSLLNSSKQIGIIGMGTIGSALLTLLQKSGKKPIFYDSNSKNISNTNSSASSWPSLDSLINDSDVVIGTTGTDALKGISFDRVKGEKIFIGASSADVEFGSLLKLSETISDPFETIRLTVKDDLVINIMNGGFPINFDRKGDATPSEDIVLTRSLMYIGAMQAAKLFGSKPAIYNVDKISQKNLLEKWIEDKEATHQSVSLTKEDVGSIVEFSGLENAKDMPSVWQSN
jgi:S-adenosylhomocysteine hydrolase